MEGDCVGREEVRGTKDANTAIDERQKKLEKH